jgi:hypothetical protein
MIALHRKHVTLVREIKAAEAAFAAEPRKRTGASHRGARQFNSELAARP